MMERHAITSAHCVAAVQSLGGMLGPVLFMLPDGRQVAPLHVAPWFDDPTRGNHPPILQELRGEWPCVPFGADAPRNLPPGWPANTGTSDVPHGHGSNLHWRFNSVTSDAVEMVCDYPETHPIRRLWRHIKADAHAPALTITLRIEARAPCALPLGLHPTLRLPADGTGRLIPPRFAMGRVFPIDVEPGRGLLRPDATFTDLAQVPARNGGTLSLLDLPLAADTEELVQLCGVEGQFALAHGAEGWQVRLHWDAGVFPSLLLWVSNRGRDYAPWNGRHVALGAEPIASAFDLGPAVSGAANPIKAGGTATVVHLHPDAPFETQYRISVEPLKVAP